MSWKSLGLSILALVVTVGLLLGTTFLFMIHYLLGIIGIVLLIAVPSIIIRNAINEARGLIDKLIAQYLMSAVIIIIGAITVMMILGLLPSPFQ